MCCRCFHRTCRPLGEPIRPQYLAQPGRKLAFMTPPAAMVASAGPLSLWSTDTLRGHQRVTGTRPLVGVLRRPRQSSTLQDATATAFASGKASAAEDGLVQWCGLGDCPYLCQMSPSCWARGPTAGATLKDGRKPTECLSYEQDFGDSVIEVRDTARWLGGARQARSVACPASARYRGRRGSRSRVDR